MKIYHSNDPEDKDHFGNLCDRRCDKREPSDEDRLRNTKAPVRTFSRFAMGETHRSRECGLMMANRYMACVNVALSPSLLSLCVFFIWRIYGDFYHKYFAMFILLAIVLKGGFLVSAQFLSSLKLELLAMRDAFVVRNKKIRQISLINAFR